jgi:hypothetical protein
MSGVERGGYDLGNVKSLIGQFLVLPSPIGLSTAKVFLFLLLYQNHLLYASSTKMEAFISTETLVPLY